MLSSTTRKRLQDLFAAQEDYRPSPEIAGALCDKTIVMLVGATCEGKNTIMDAVAAEDSRFKMVGRFTSRDPRPGDNAELYTYYKNTDEGLQGILQAIDDRSVVQYAINPHAQLMYGSNIADYTGDYNLADTFSSAVSGLHELGFKRSLAITIIAKPDAWLARFNDRFPLGHPQRQARRDEAIESFSWSLAQPQNKQHFWVENIDGEPNSAAQEVIHICLHGSTGQPKARKLAEASLEAAQRISV